MIFLSAILTTISGFEICKGLTLILCFLNGTTDVIASINPFYMLFLGFFKFFLGFFLFKRKEWARKVFCVFMIALLVSVKVHYSMYLWINLSDKDIQTGCILAVAFLIFFMLPDVKKIFFVQK